VHVIGGGMVMLSKGMVGFVLFVHLHRWAVIVKQDVSPVGFDVDVVNSVYAVNWKHVCTT
jgi:hypothetical protein